MSFALMYDECFLDHIAPSSHPECPERLDAVWRRLTEQDLISKSMRVPARPATTAELTRAHAETMVREVLDAISSGEGFLDPDTFFSPGSRTAALNAAGGTVDTARAVYEKRADFGLALLRPPGHHATARRPMGFCIFNNIAIATHALLAGGAQRILIFDWDVHHGNGTQDIFYTDPRVLFISVHQWPQYPGSGRPSEIGDGPGRGFTANLPFPAHSGNADYAAAVRQVLFPLAEKFNPEMVLVSAGFDAHESDPLGGMRVTTEGFAHLTQAVMEIAKPTGRGPCFVLEGGYNLNGLANSVAAMVRTALGEKPASISGTASPACTAVIDATLASLSGV